MAGVLGGATLGLFGGMIAGGVTGKKVGNKKHPVTPEVQILKDEVDGINQQHRNIVSKYNDATSDYNLQALKDKYTDKYINSLTVGQVDDLIYDHFNDAYHKGKTINKQASLKSTLISAGVVGVPMAIGLGKSVYRDTKESNTDVNYWNKNKDDAIANLTKTKSLEKQYGNGKDLPRDHIPYGPVNLANLDYYDSDEDGYIDRAVRDHASKHGIDIQKMPMKDYKDLATKFWNEGYDNFDD